MKRGLIFLTALCFICVQIYAKSPKKSGNYEQGSRYAVDYDEVEYPTFWFEQAEEDIDQENWADNFEIGY